VALSSSSPVRVQHLDGWRGLSLLLVLFGHFVQGNVHVAVFGVYLFFALSGRLMAEILFVDGMGLGEFYRRRLSRIYPALLAFVVFAAVALQNTDLAIDGTSVAAALTFTLNYRLAAWHSAFPIENLWSLCIEEHAYVLLGLVAVAVRSRRVPAVPALLGVAALSLVDGWISLFLLHQQGRTVYWRTDTQLAPIFLAAAAYLIFRGRAVAAWVPLAGLVAAVSAIFAPMPLGYALIPASLALAVATLDRASPGVRAALSWKPLTGLGLASYSIYLWQHPFYRLSLNHAAPWWGLLAAGVLAGLASYRLLEQPARRWLNAIGRGPAAQSTSSSSIGKIFTERAVRTAAAAAAIHKAGGPRRA
jgi:peptidoglycan/LPS O-acetylase OafA/YrhL